MSIAELFHWYGEHPDNALSTLILAWAIWTGIVCGAIWCFQLPLRNLKLGDPNAKDIIGRYQATPTAVALFIGGGGSMLSGFIMMQTESPSPLFEQIKNAPLSTIPSVLWNYVTHPSSRTVTELVVMVIVTIAIVALGVSIDRFFDRISARGGK